MLALPEELMRGWVAPIYAFFEPRPTIEYKGGRRSHLFKCAKKNCKAKEGVRRYLDTQDSTSTSNMRRHVERCWGSDALKIAQALGNAEDAWDQIFEKVLREVPLTAHFERKKGGHVSYMHRNFTKPETRFLTLMKTGHPAYYIPSPSTVSRDVKTVFARTRNRIAKLLQEYDGKLNFTTDGWTSPNHHAFIALCVHFEYKDTPISVVLDVVEVARSHTGVHLAEAFADVLKEFGIDAKVSGLLGNVSRGSTH
ncbi:hypothetical protein LXA43DRAFT_905787 [Ganoderma leucocontextum]|nr:hypothetical protein LXA43DRAFT_905787 [Ganoderma leucocontextum]